MTTRTTSFESGSNPLGELSDEDLAVITALRRIRSVAGAVYSQDLYESFGIDSKRSAAEKDALVLQRLNEWLTEPIINADSTGTSSLSGAVELVSVYRWRVFIDVLTGLADGTTPKLHPVSIVEHGNTRSFTYEEFVPPVITDASRAHWATAVENRVNEIRQSGTINRTVVNKSNILERATWDEDECQVIIDLANCYVEEFSIEVVKAEFDDKPGDVKYAIRAREAIFDGTKSDFSKTMFSEIDFSWAVFNTPVVSFEHAEFAAEAETETGSTKRIINFRDTTYCGTVTHLDFDYVRFTNETLRFSMEDSVLRGARVSFEKAEFGTTFVDFYQARFLEGSRVQFLETSMGESSIDFADSYFEPSKKKDEETPTATIDYGGDVVFYRVEPLANADLVFAHIGDLRIFNSTIENPIKLGGIESVSLWRTEMSGGLVRVVPINGSKHWFLAAVHGQSYNTIDGTRSGPTPKRSTLREEISNEFAVLKEVFHGQGEYDLEDDAFVRHMQTKDVKWFSRAGYNILDIVGRFGTAPMRILISYVVTWAFWFVTNWTLMATIPNGYAYPQGHVFSFADAFINASAGMLQQNAIFPAATVWTQSVWFLQLTFGWFFLGYFFSALIRKTLR